MFLRAPLQRQPDRLDLPTPERRKAELTLVLVIYTEMVHLSTGSNPSKSNHLMRVEPMTSWSQVQRPNRYATKSLPFIEQKTTDNDRDYTSTKAECWCVESEVPDGRRSTVNVWTADDDRATFIDAQSWWGVCDVIADRCPHELSQNCTNTGAPIKQLVN